jgi:hypothetical protein
MNWRPLKLRRESALAVGIAIRIEIDAEAKA